MHRDRHDESPLHTSTTGFIIANIEHWGHSLQCRLTKNHPSRPIPLERGLYVSKRPIMNIVFYMPICTKGIAKAPMCNVNSESCLRSYEGSVRREKTE